MQIKSEWDLLKKIKKFIKENGLIPPRDLLESIGDDCAVFKPGGNKQGLITTDMSIESTDFRLNLSSLEDVGFKAMMGNVSDIAAMGGKPRFAFISLGLTEKLKEEDVLGLYKGLLEAANMAGVIISGGDLSASKEIILNIALYGETIKKNPVKRSGAKPGNIIYITGKTGASRAGLEILLSGKKRNSERFPGLIRQHKRPVARFAAVKEIINRFNPASMIDISDGLLSDLRHICESSNTGFRLNEEHLPFPDELRIYCAELKRSHFEYALTSGEEYELLFTSEKVLKKPIELGTEKIPVTPIGEITEEGFYISGCKGDVEIPITGYDHFKID